MRLSKHEIKNLLKTGHTNKYLKVAVPGSYAYESCNNQNRAAFRSPQGILKIIFCKYVKGELIEVRADLVCEVESLDVVQQKKYWYWQISLVLLPI